MTQQLWEADDMHVNVYYYFNLIKLAVGGVRLCTVLHTNKE